MFTSHPTVAIIGMGFAGNMAFANLIRQAKKPLAITLIDPAPEWGLGVAYSTTAPYHLLNVRADRMGAFADDAGGFYYWLSSSSGAAITERATPGMHYGPEDYAPRMLYGAYMKDILAQAMREAERKHITVTRLTQQAVDIRRENSSYAVMTAEGNACRANAVILALGNLPPRRFACEKNLLSDTRYVSNIWQPPEDSVFPHLLAALPSRSDIVIIGTGLTMVDAVLTLHHQGYKGRITAISRHALLPAVHTATAPYSAWALSGHPLPLTAQAMLRLFRREVKHAGNWRDVIDSLRPVTQRIWAGFSERDKKRMARLLPYWNSHRHRMAPAIHAALQSMMQNGALRVVAGRVENILPREEGLVVSLCERGAAGTKEITAACVLNCTGPEMDVSKSDHTLLQQLLRTQLITKGPAGMGAMVAKNESLFLLGTLRSGELLESTAVPEVRLQAKEVAGEVIKILQL